MTDKNNLPENDHFSEKELGELRQSLQPKPSSKWQRIFSELYDTVGYILAGAAILLFLYWVLTGQVVPFPQ